MTECVICKQKISTDKEKYVRLTDFNGKIQTGEVFYHLECWRERFMITNSARKKEMYAKAAKAITSMKDKFGNGGLVVAQ